MMKKVIGFGAAIFTCVTPLLGAFIYVNGPEWIRLSNGAYLTMSTMLTAGFSLVVARAIFLSVYEC